MPSARSALVIGVAELASEASASASAASRIESRSIVDGPGEAVCPPDPGKHNAALSLWHMLGRQGLTPINLKLFQK